jgi:glucose/arabinose dehydrogenase
MKAMKRIVKKFPFSTVAAATLLVLVAALFAMRAMIVRYAFEPTESEVELGFESADWDDAVWDAGAGEQPPEVPLGTFAEGMHVPWEVAFLPNGDTLVTERSGTLRRFGMSPASFAVPGVVEISEGGLLGLALDPDPSSRKIFMYYTTRAKDGAVMNRVSSFLLGEKLSDENVIIDKIPAGNYHDGGRIAFGPDGKLYVTTGDAGDGNRSQDKNSLAGKILRVNADGTIPADNPFGNATWSYGHRNPQGLAWDDKGRLWATEHGRSGAKSGLDELNLIVKGGNYGWPVIEGDKTHAGMIVPVKHSGEKDTWAPSGMAFVGGSLWFGGLRGSSLYQAEIGDDGTVTRLRAHLRNEYGRLRAVTQGTDGALYVSTSNDDGRGTPRPGDDRVLRIVPSLLINE